MEIKSDPIFFTNQEEFREWLVKNHASKLELWVGYYRVGTGKPSMTWSQSVDQALCFGWIDGLRKSIDSEGYCIRFTPRKANSNWSLVNINKVEELTKQGLMMQAGIASYRQRKNEKSGIYTYESIKKAKLSKEFEKLFKENAKAWNNFCQMAPSYQLSAINWVMSAKMEVTRNNRLQALISDSEAGIKVKPYRY